MIRTEKLTKTFKKNTVVQDVNLDVQAGRVFGFLGPNGAGKTTTIRMLLGLIRPTQGTAFIMGRDVQQDHAVLRNVGALVEGPAFYHHMSGRANLEVLAHTYGDYTVGGYSLGMKQRLGLAAALLHDPKIVILDEPTNGLDPIGIQEMRGLIRDLAVQDGRTVLLSSHLLSEVAQTCDDIAIIHKGRIVQQGDIQTLMQSAKPNVRLEVNPISKANLILSERWAARIEGDALLVQATRADLPQIIRQLVADDVEVFGATVEAHTLEDIFFSAVDQPAPATAEAAKRKVG
jgi:ABC-type multidrug transport system ATPase subunit